MTDAPEISFEFFPPTGASGAMRLWRAVERLAPLGPRFVSVTYGAGGSTRDRTVAAVAAISDRARLPVAGHLTCVGASRRETLAVARLYRRAGARRIVALRGDMPGGGPFEAHPEGFADAAELVAALRAEGDFHITVAAYPEPHPDATGPDADIDALKAKFDAGADAAITQFFFDPDDYLRFRDRCAARGIHKPIIPGVLPIEDFAKLTRFATRCGATVPTWLRHAFGRAETAAEARLLSVAVAADLCDTLRGEGVEAFHIFTLNDPDLPYQVARALGAAPAPMRLAAAGGACA